MASLGNDLAQIREKRNLTLNDLQKTTKIPKRILRSIENDSIFTDLKENPTYIRSYIRSYAKAIAIDDEQIIRALDKREKNDYSGALQQIAGIEPSSSEIDDEDEDEEKETTESTSEQDDDPNYDHSPDFSFEKEKDESTSPPHATPSQSRTPDSVVHSINWAEMGQQFQPIQTERSKIWFGIVIVFLITLGGSFVYFFNSTSSNTVNTPNNTSTQESSASLSTDSLELNIAPSANEDTTVTELAESNTNTSRTLQNRTLNALPDTLDMIVYAAHGKLEPVRVYTDIMGDTNPYWVEQGDAVRFDFVNEIRIRGQYNNIALMLNGHAIQNFLEQFYNPETRLVEINRSYFEGDSRWLQPAPDSLGIDAPPPSVIRERPTYN